MTRYSQLPEHLRKAADRLIDDQLEKAAPKAYRQAVASLGEEAQQSLWKRNAEKTQERARNRPRIA